MKILFVNQSSFISPTGAERSALNAAIGLSELGHTVEFLQCDEIDKQETQGVGGHTFQSYSVETDPLHSEFGLETAAEALETWLNQRAGLQTYDLVHTHNSAAHLAVGRSVVDLPTIGTVRDYRWLCEGDAMCYTQCDNLRCCSNFLSQTRCSYGISNHNIAFLPLVAARTAYRMRIQDELVSALENIDHIVSISNFIKKILLSQIDLDSSKITTIYNSVIKDQYPKDSSNNTNDILFIGSLKPQKGILEAVRAFSIVAEEVDSSRLIVAGDGRLRDQAESEAENHGVSEKVEFKGHVGREKIIELYQRASVVVYPSIWPEPFGRISIEAMASKTPIVGSKNGAIPEVLDDWPASKISDPRNEKSFASAILHMMKLSHSQLNMELNERYTHEWAAAEHQHLYDQVGNG